MKTLFALAILVFSILLAAPAAAQMRQVRGTLDFLDVVNPSSATPTTVARSIRNAPVTITLDGVQVGTTTTGSNGAYSVMIPSASLPAGHTLRVACKSRDAATKVLVNLIGDVEIALEWGTSTTVPSGITDIIVNDTITVAESSQYFSILDAIATARGYADGLREDDDDIGEVNVLYPSDEWSRYDDGDVGRISLSGPDGPRDDGFQDGVVIHELGHHLQYEISDKDDGAGSGHDVCTAEGYEGAWTEGWPTFFGRTVKDNNSSRLADSFSNLEDAFVCSPDAPDTEGKVRNILWDLYDGPGAPPNEQHDRVDGLRVANNGITIRATLFGIFDVEQDDASLWIDPSTSILSFHDAYVGRNLYEGAHADLDRIYAAHNVYRHALSDFSILSVTAPATAITGTSVTVGMTVRNTSSLAYTDEELQVTIFGKQSGGSEQSLYTLRLQPFTGDRAFTRSVPIPSSFTQNLAWFYVRADPTDRFPESNEGNNLTTKSFSVLKCGNGTCSAGESCMTCAADCGPCCGNGSCNGSETCTSCPGDCGPCPTCGDDFCNGGENAHTCPTDCGI